MAVLDVYTCERQRGSDLVYEQLLYCCVTLGERVAETTRAGRGAKLLLEVGWICSDHQYTTAGQSQHEAKGAQADPETGKGDCLVLDTGE